MKKKKGKLIVIKSMDEFKDYIDKRLEETKKDLSQGDD